MDGKKHGEKYGFNIVVKDFYVFIYFVLNLCGKIVWLYSNSVVWWRLILIFLSKQKKNKDNISIILSVYSIDKNKFHKLCAINRKSKNDD